VRPRPAPVVAVLLLAVALRSAPAPAEALRWALLAAAFCSVLPTLYILRGVRRGRLTDHHVRLRRQRRGPLLVAGASVLVALALLLATGAPRDVVALVGAGGAGLAVAVAITQVWKISVHAAVAAGAVVVLVLVFGPALLVLAPLVALSAWARVQLGDHTPAPAAAGAAVGATVARTARVRERRAHLGSPTTVARSAAITRSTRSRLPAPRGGTWRRPGPRRARDR
jgi:hypothetical protein